LEYNNKKYYVNKVQQLLSEAELAFSKKYIDGDKIVEYPININYIDFLENPLKELK
jgi:hypothetical protein